MLLGRGAHVLVRRYMPAELLLGSYMSKAVDVYSFSMLMHELVTGTQLFEGMRQSQACPRPAPAWSSPHAGLLRCLHHAAGI